MLLHAHITHRSTKGSVDVSPTQVFLELNFDDRVLEFFIGY
jgi:hypothetical protein